MFSNQRQQNRQGCACRIKGYVFAEGLVVVLWAVAVVTVHLLVKPPVRGFFCDDQSIRYPYRPDTVTGNLLLALTFGIPVAVIATMEAVNYLISKRGPSASRRRGGQQRSPRSRNNASGLTRGATGATRPEGWLRGARVLVVYVFGYLVMTMAVLILKACTGVHRPNFLDLCQPDALNDSSVPCRGQYISEYNCTNTDKESELKDARMSLPSGHAAYAFYTAAFVIMYVEHRVVNRRLALVRLTFHALLTMYALWVSATRLVDHKHHLRDVVIGALLGLLAALGAFFGAVLEPSTTRCGTTTTSTSNNVSRDEENPANNPYDDHHHDDNGDKMAGVNTSHNNNNNRIDDDDDDDDVESGNLDALDMETPTTPTPLLFNGVMSLSSYSNTGMRIGPLRLEGDKHKFPRRATLQ